MFGQGLFSWFSTSKTESSENAQPTWDPNTLTMTQPQSPAAPTTENVVANQPTPTEDMQLELRGGGGPDDDCCCCCCFCGDCCGPDGPPGGPDGPSGGPPGGPPGPGGPGGW
ncbi:hypothetical protein BDV33DRAFT_27621 [Aspergillus novoparasiticus]|uniref:Cysteine-rich transmembrane CYSTM domain-containing protein n=1 Tax=Aspergillus novoparasiticus TaxID=986946 RepID=A0A5N6EAN2_9EURO|nr:hypothetical protein BDV33DRAFT_27621 [Aspergillus novoparasiticus]